MRTPQTPIACSQLAPIHQPSLATMYIRNSWHNRTEKKIRDLEVYSKFIACSQLIKAPIHEPSLAT